MTVQLQDILSGGSVTEVKVGGTTADDALVIKGDIDDDLTTGLALKRDLTDMEFGTSTDNITISASGNMTFNGDGTTFEDVNMDPTMLTGRGALPTSVDFASTGVPISSFQNNRSDEVAGIREYPHGGKLNPSAGTDVILSFHVHAYAQTTGGGNVRLELEYFFSEEDVAITTSTTLQMTVAVPTVAWAKRTMTFPDIVVPETLGAQFHFRFKRLGSDALDSYADDLAISTIGFHVESDKTGSDQITTK